MYSDREQGSEKEATIRNRKFDAIGLSPEEFDAACKALDEGDSTTIRWLTERSSARLTELAGSFPPSTKDRYFSEEQGFYDSERGELHERIIKTAFEGKEPQNHPMITLLAGPPGVGKSLYKSTIFSSRGVVETDPDAIKTRLYPGYDGLNPAHIAETHDESLDIAQMILDEAMLKRFSVVCESTLRHPEWVNHVLTKATDNNYNVEVLFFHKSLAGCFRDGFDRFERPVSLPLLLSSIAGYDTFQMLQEDERLHTSLFSLEGDRLEEKTADRGYRNAMLGSLVPFRSIASEL